MRPAMLLLAGDASGQLNDGHVTMAAVVEMVHTATLIHDDVLDGADRRRHVATVNACWDNHTSILLGDYLFAQSFRLAATLPSTECCRLVGEASRLVCEGELRQVHCRDWIDLDETTYLQMIGGKTAELCRVATEVGGLLSGADGSMVRKMADYGRAVGMAFQIADDHLDLWGKEATVGKTLGTDLRQGKMTLPVIRLLATSDRSNRRRIQAILRGPAESRFSGIRGALESGDAEAYTLAKAQAYQARAVDSLRKLPDSPAKRSLVLLAQFAVDRRR